MLGVVIGQTVLPNNLAFKIMDLKIMLDLIIFFLRSSKEIPTGAVYESKYMICINLIY